MKNARPTEVKPSAIQNQLHSINPADVLQNAPTKLSRILAGLLTFGSMNGPEALNWGDTCLNSTIAKLTGTYGLTFDRVTEDVPTRWGAAPARFVRYSIPDCYRADALALLEYLVLKSKGGAAE